jgi:hypothetical protein
MRRQRFIHDRPSRKVLAAVVILAGAVLAGCDAGIGLPSDCPTGVDCSAPPTVLGVAVQPPYATVLVGTAVTYTATSSNVSGTARYQWSRSSDGGVDFVDIAGATGRACVIAAVNLSDDAAVFRVTVHDGGATTASASGRLVVSATPGRVFRDTAFQAADWLATPLGNADAASPGHSEDSPVTGGNPGAFRRMVIQIAPQSGSGRMFYTSLVAAYDPRTQGAIRLVDYAEDSIALQPSSTTSTHSAMLLEQGGRHYVANLRNDATDFIPATWSASQSRASLQAADFNRLDGPACQSGEACPDFSAQGGAMRFGYWRISFGTPGDSIAHGIDNWQVTVWPR